MRVSPPRVFPRATRSAKPPSESEGSVDAYRQTGFLLAPTVDLLVEGLNAEGAIAQASSSAKYRTQKMAAAMGPWSRSWLTRLQALHAVEWGNYVAAAPLVRSAADYQAAEVALLGDGATEWDEWLAAGGVGLELEDHATRYRLHSFRSAETLAAHPVLGPVYRASTDLSLSHFGATLMLTGNDSSSDRIAITFGDRDFHLGLAEIEIGWLLALGVVQLDTLLECRGVFCVEAPALLAELRARVAAREADSNRCRIEPLDAPGDKRYLVQNWRRSPGAAAKRLVL